MDALNENLKAFDHWTNVKKKCFDLNKHTIYVILLK